MRVTTKDVLAGFERRGLAKGLRPKTVAWYREMLAPLRRRYELLPQTPEEVEELLGELSDPGRPRGPVKDETRWDYYVALRVLYNWAARRLGVVNVMDAIEKPRRRREPKPSLTEVQLVRVMGEAKSGRDRALLTLLADTGLRIGEAHSLRWQNVATGYVVVTGKTGTREVPVSEWTRWALMGTDLPWTGRRGELEVRALADIVRRCLRRAGIESGGAHLMRHTFARLYLRAGGNVFTLQRILGHAHLSTTRGYVDLDLGDIIEEHGRFSPIVRLLGRAAGEEKEVSGWQR